MTFWTHTMQNTFQRPLPHCAWQVLSEHSCASYTEGSAETRLIQFANHLPVKDKYKHWLGVFIPSHIFFLPFTMTLFLLPHAWSPDTSLKTHPLPFQYFKPWVWDDSFHQSHSYPPRKIPIAKVWFRFDLSPKSKSCCLASWSVPCMHFSFSNRVQTHHINV